MRLRGLVFERFVAFERAEVDLCDEDGAPLEVVLFVGESGSGKTALLRGISGLLTEAAGAEAPLGEEDMRRDAEDARCRVVFDDVEASGRVVVTLEKEITRGGPRPSTRDGSIAGSVGLRATPFEAFDRWRKALAREAPRAAFSIESDDRDSADDEPEGADPTNERDPLFEWLFGLRGGPQWEQAIDALNRVLWPFRFDHVSPTGDLLFSTPSGLARVDELGDAFGSVLVMTLELLRLSTESPNGELLYVIDDIDAHLHPRWQSHLVPDLRRAFPRVQLVATTQSPFVVASAEPYQVFRLEGTGVVRISDRIQRGSSVSHVMDLAFGAPDLPGPRWLHTPPLAVRRELLRTVDDELTRGAVVYALPDPIHVKDVRDAFGEAVLPFNDGVIGHLFFIDLEPGAAWGHPCEYVFRTREGRLSRKRAIWPPPALDRFVAIGRG